MVRRTPTTLLLFLVACTRREGDDASPAAPADAQRVDEVLDVQSLDAQDATTRDAPSDVVLDAVLDASPAWSSSPPQLLTAEASFYPRLIRRSDGRLLASVVTLDAAGALGAAFFESEDGGRHFVPIGTIDEPLAHTGLCCATLYELPRALGVLSAGSIVWSASVGGDTPAAPMRLVLWSSTDGGRRWTRLNDIITASVPLRQGGLWEPEFSMLEDGSLACHYSDETDPAHSQKLVVLRTRDAARWEQPHDTVALANHDDRPGMAVVRRGPSGRFFMSYEICGPTYDCTTHLRSSADGWDWGPPTSEGSRVVTHDGEHVRGAPTLAWTDAPGPFGRMYLVAQMAHLRDGAISPNTGRVVLANSERGEGFWFPIAAPVEVDVPARGTGPELCRNYSSPILPLPGGASVVELASRWDGVRCRTYFARGSLLGTGDDFGVVPGARYVLVNSRSGLCLDVTNGSLSPGGRVQQWTCNGLAPQEWRLQPGGGGVYALQSRHSGLCLSAPAASAGAALEQRPCDGSVSQRWIPRNRGVGYYVFELDGAGSCVDVAGGSVLPGGPVQAWSCNELSPQRWQLRLVP